MQEKIAEEKAEAQKIADSVKKKEQLMSKEKIKRENEKKELDHKHSAELEDLKKAGMTNLMIGAAGALVFAIVAFYVMGSGASSSAGASGAGSNP